MSNKNENFNRLRVYGFLEKMTDEEWNLYKKNPSGYNAYKINLQSEALKKANKLVIPELDSTVYYFLDKHYNMKILKISGPLSRKSKKDQNIIIENHIIETTDSVFKKLIEISDKKDNIIKNECVSSNNEKINELKELKNSLLNSIDNDNKEIEKEKKFIKKK